MALDTEASDLDGIHALGEGWVAEEALAISETLLLFTLRNGSICDNLNKKPYAEKIIVVEENRITPMHIRTHNILHKGAF